MARIVITEIMDAQAVARLAQLGNRFRQDWGTRAAGVLLVAVAVWGLWMDLSHRIAVWCGLA